MNSENRLPSSFTRWVHRLLPDGLLRHSLLLLIATHAANLANILFQMVMGRMLSGNEFSVLATVLGLILIIATPLQALRTAVAHHAARLVREGNRGDILPLFLRWSGLTAMLAVPVSLVCLAGSGWIADLFSFSSRGPIVAFSAVILVTPFVPVAMGILQGIQDFRWMSVATALASVVRLGVGACLVIGIAATATWGIAGHAVGVAGALLLGIAVVRMHCRGAAPSGVRVQASVPYFLRSWLVLGCLAILMNGDIILVRYFLLEESDVFAKAATIARSVIFIPIPIAFAMFPKVTSAGALSAEDWRTFKRALGYSVGLIGLALGACLVVPWLPIRILFGIADPSAELVFLVRVMVLAMCPLGLAYLVMHFELAQHRFGILAGGGVSAVLYVGGVALFHDSVLQVAGWLAGSSLFCLAVLFAGLPSRRPGQGTDTGRE